MAAPLKADRMHRLSEVTCHWTRQTTSTSMGLPGLQLGASCGGTKHSGLQLDRCPVEKGAPACRTGVGGCGTLTMVHSPCHHYQQQQALRQLMAAAGSLPAVCRSGRVPRAARGSKELAPLVGWLHASMWALQHGRQELCTIGLGQAGSMTPCGASRMWRHRAGLAG